MKNLASVQRTIWLTQNIYADSSLYNIGGYALIQGQLNVSVLIRAIKTVLNDADVISVGYYAFNELPLESNMAFIKYDIASVDLSESTDPSNAVQDWMQQDMREPFTVSANLLKIRIIKCQNNDYYWYTKAHHLIFDGYSMSLFFRNVSSLYAAFSDNTGNTAALEQYPYASFILEDQEYRSSDRYAADRSYWINRLRNSGTATAFRSCAPTTSSRSLTSARKELTIKKEIYRQIEQYCEQYNCTAFHYFIAVIFVLNSCYGNPVPVIGLPVFNRYNKQLKRTIGTCVNILPFSLSQPGNVSFRELLIQIKDELKACYRHQRFPLYDILEALNTEGNIYNITFSFQKNTYEAGPGGLSSFIKYIHSGEQEEDLAFHLLAYAEEEDLTLSLDYRQDLYPEHVINNLLRHFDTLLHMLLLPSSQPVYTIDILSTAEKEQLLNTFNATHRSLPQGKTILDLFE
ncbi:condensation domain-containing protein, partial [uncultured Chitinophaga sp.]|uniref:condensation domain-containing protein n=1 Tax=uncultured Chitinophaga sp. TaxID=339340 RepID=UPI00261A1A2D